VINVKRLQVILDEMAQWEQEVFEKEYADMNWYKGKQAKHVKEMELGRKRSKLGSLVLFIYIAHNHKYYSGIVSFDGTTERDI
jgi:5'-3' exonuclease